MSSCEALQSFLQSLSLDASVESVGQLYQHVVHVAANTLSPQFCATAVLQQWRRVLSCHSADDAATLLRRCGVVRSAKEVRAFYAEKYRGAAHDRLAEDALRGQKTKELLCQIVLRLECLARITQTGRGVERTEVKELCALLETVSVLLISPTDGEQSWMDWIDFLHDEFSDGSLESTLKSVFDRLEVEPHCRDRRKRARHDPEDGSEAVHQGQDTEQIQGDADAQAKQIEDEKGGGDMKRLRSHLANKVEADMSNAQQQHLQQQQEKKLMKRSSSGTSLGSLRLQDQQKKKSTANTTKAHVPVQKKVAAFKTSKKD